MTDKNISLWWYWLLLLLLLLIFSLRLFGALSANQQLAVPSTLSGLITTAPVFNGWLYTFKIGETTVSTTQKITVTLGDLVAVTGQPKIVIGEAGVKDGELTKATVTLLKPFGAQPLFFRYTHPVLWFRSYLLFSKQTWLEHLSRYLSADETALVAGMILGEKTMISKNLMTQLQTSGLIHLVVASGSNIALLAGVIRGLTIGLVSQKKTLWLTFSAVVSYMLLAGLEPPLIRATVMIGLSYMCGLFGKKTAAVWVLTLTALSMLIQKPLLLFSVSFQLSIAATAGIILFGTFFEEKVISFAGFSVWKKDYVSPLLSALSQTLAAQVFIVPLLLHLFGKTNLLSVGANVLVAPVVSVVIFLGICLLVCAFLFPLAATFVSWVINLFTGYFFTIVHLFSSNLVISANWELPWVGVFLAWSGALFFLNVITRPDPPWAEIKSG